MSLPPPGHNKARRTKERCLPAHSACLLVRQKLLVPLVRCETNCHLWDDARKDGTKTFIQTQRRLSFYNLFTRGIEAAPFRLEPDQHRDFLAACLRVDVLRVLWLVSKAAYGL